MVKQGKDAVTKAWQSHVKSRGRRHAPASGRIRACGPNGEGSRPLPARREEATRAERALVRASQAGELRAWPPGSGALPRAAAFFDLDRTLMAGSSGIFFAKAAFETGMISRSRLVKDIYENLRFRLVGSTDDRADAVRIRVGEMIAGVPVRDLERLAPRVLAGVLPRLYPDMLARAYAHQDAGRLVFIVTAASQEMADLLAHVLAFDGGLGSRSEVVDGVYTGRAAGPFNYRDGKRISLHELAQRQDIELAESYAYSDSESDLPMLRAVGHPVAVNPDAELARVAIEEGWEIVRLDRLGRRLKLIAAVGSGVAMASLGSLARGRLVGEVVGDQNIPRRTLPLQSGSRGRARDRERPSGADSWRRWRG